MIGFIRGEIVSGDYERVVSFYRRHHPFLTRFMLHSSGGNVDEALKIGKLLRKFLIFATAPTQIGGLMFLSTIDPKGSCQGAGCLCASACALIWFGAPERTGTVGLHRPRTTDPRFAQLPPDEAAKVYRVTLDRVGRYLDDMEAPKSVIEAMVSTGSADILWMDDGIHGGHRMDHAPSFAEWADASCGAFPTQEYATMIALRAKQQEHELSRRDAEVLKRLSDKNDQQNWCVGRLVASNRDKIARP